VPVELEMVLFDVVCDVWVELATQKNSWKQHPTAQTNKTRISVHPDPLRFDSLQRDLHRLR
jgi:hypothetical protein